MAILDSLPAALGVSAATGAGLKWAWDMIRDMKRDRSGDAAESRIVRLYEKKVQELEGDIENMALSIDKLWAKVDSLQTELDEQRRLRRAAEDANDKLQHENRNLQMRVSNLENSK